MQGNLLVQLIALGAVEDLAQARAVVQASAGPEIRRVEPSGADRATRSLASVLPPPTPSSALAHATPIAFASAAVMTETSSALPLMGLEAEPKAIWFGILVLMTVGIGLIAPPVGLNVYVVNNLAGDTPMGETYKGVFPFLAWDVLRVIVLLLYMPIFDLAGSLQ